MRFGLHVKPDSSGLYIIEYLFVVLSVKKKKKENLPRDYPLLTNLTAVCLHRSSVCPLGALDQTLGHGSAPIYQS